MKRFCMNWIAATTWTVALFAAPAWATQVNYEGNVFPEEDGWLFHGDAEDPAVYSRSITDGLFSINATATGGATVYYERDLLMASDRMVCEWRVQTSNDDGDGFLAIYLLPSWANIVVSWGATSGFAYGYKGTGQFTPATDFALSSDEFHTFRIESEGTLYKLLVDGAERLESELVSAEGLAPMVQWGFVKNEHNIPTTEKYDYIRVFDVPEPCSLLIMGAAWCLGGTLRRSRGMRGLIH